MSKAGSNVRFIAPRVTRKQAAKILNTSYENVKRLQRLGQLRGVPDRQGIHRFDKREVEELARRRGRQVPQFGEFAASVFQLFKAGREFHDIVIETKQDPEVILALWQQYKCGFEYGKETDGESSEQREQREHDEQMRAMDLELERRRRSVHEGHKAESEPAPKRAAGGGKGGR